MLTALATRRFGSEYWIVAVLCCALAAGVRLNAHHAFAAARDHYVQSSRAEAEAVAEKLEGNLLAIYANLRTVACLPTLRSLDPPDSEFGPRDRATVGQLAHSLAAAIPVSAVYVAPGNLDPERIDGTDQPAEPMPAQQSRQMQAQFAWLNKVVPMLAPDGALSIPMVSGPEIVTGDTSVSRRTGLESDRAGLIFSVPYYGSDNRLKGTVSAVVLSSALRKLLPPENYALLNPGYDYVSGPSRGGQERLSADFVGRGVPDPRLIYSDRIVLSLPDHHSNWAVWVGRPDADFTGGSEARAAHLFEAAGYAVIAALMVAGVFCTTLLRRNADLTALAKARLERLVAERTAEIRHMATHDPLTGAANRTLLSETMVSWLGGLGPGECLALLCIDLDRFKAVNDSYGHPAGDALLKGVTARIRDCIGPTDLLARLGGDEFVVLHRTAAGRTETGAMALAIIGAVDCDFELGAFSVRVGASVGIALAPDQGTDPDQLLAQADLALYRAKHDGRGRCRFFDAGMAGSPPEQRCSEYDLRRAIAGGELVLHYQPIVDAGTREIVGVEALVRWAHPVRGLVAPLDFIPLAEETGLIVPLGDWVVRQACEDARQLPSHVKVAVNLSAAQFRSPGLAARVAVAIGAANIAAARLELEITESRLLDDSDETLAILHGLKLIGVRLVVDDFGAGYSCLAHLGRFPLDKLKFDRAFMRDIDDGGLHAAIVKSVATLCADFGIGTTAEGIETATQAELARQQGCRELQGYFFSKPLAIAELAERLRLEDAKAA